MRQALLPPSPCTRRARSPSASPADVNPQKPARSLRSRPLPSQSRHSSSSPGTRRRLRRPAQRRPADGSWWHAQSDNPPIVRRRQRWWEARRSKLSPQSGGWVIIPAYCVAAGADHLALTAPWSRPGNILPRPPAARVRVSAALGRGAAVQTSRRCWIRCSAEVCPRRTRKWLSSRPRLLFRAPSVPSRERPAPPRHP